MKTKKIKARKMWGNSSELLYPTKRWASYCPDVTTVNPKFVLPADAASVEAMVEQITYKWMDGTNHFTTADMARAALAAIGVKAKGGGK